MSYADMENDFREQIAALLGKLLRGDNEANVLAELTTLTNGNPSQAPPPSALDRLRADAASLGGALDSETMHATENQWLFKSTVDALREEAGNGSHAALHALSAAIRRPGPQTAAAAQNADDLLKALDALYFHPPLPAAEGDVSAPSAIAHDLVIAAWFDRTILASKYVARILEHAIAHSADPAVLTAIARDLHNFHYHTAIGAQDNNPAHKTTGDLLATLRDRLEPSATPSPLRSVIYKALRQAALTTPPAGLPLLHGLLKEAARHETDDSVSAAADAALHTADAGIAHAAAARTHRIRLGTPDLQRRAKAVFDPVPRPDRQSWLQRQFKRLARKGRLQP